MHGLNGKALVYLMRDSGANSHERTASLCLARVGTVRKVPTHSNEKHKKHPTQTFPLLCGNPYSISSVVLDK